MVKKGLILLGENESSHNSPWNIAADFEVDMSFSPVDIATMLKAYQDDHHIGMDLTQIVEEIYSYTSGYPFMVSRICQHIENKLHRDWTQSGVQAAVKILLEEKNTLFDDMSKNLENNESLREFVRSILIGSEAKKFSTDDVCVDFGVVFGYFKNVDSQVAIANKIFEIRMTNYFILRDGRTQKQITGVLKEDIIIGGKFNMALCIEKFAKHYYASFADRDLEFYERHGRLLFLAYLQPLINDTGFYHIESETRNSRRMDIVVDYGTDQFIVELKLWSGNVMHDKAYEQLLGYMDSKGATEGYLLTFDFRLGMNKKIKAEWVVINGKRIFDVVV